MQPPHVLVISPGHKVDLGVTDAAKSRAAALREYSRLAAAPPRPPPPPRLVRTWTDTYCSGGCVCCTSVFLALTVTAILYLEGALC